MDGIDHFTLPLLLAGLAGMAAVAAGRFARLVHLPAPVVFMGGGMLVLAIAGPDRVGMQPRDIAGAGTAALIVILFFGGYSTTWRHVRGALGVVLGLGLAGTLLTAVIVTAACMALPGMDLTTSVLVGIALAPTDPAAVFSVLGAHRLRPDLSTALEGEAGMNDPVGIALMIAAIAWFVGDASGGMVVTTFLAQLVIGAAIGAILGTGIASVLTRIRLGNSDLYPLSVLAMAFVTYGLAAQLHGSGFLAVFVAGLVAGDATLREQERIVAVVSTLATIAEAGLFAMLGMSLTLGDFSQGAIATAVITFGVLTVVARPVTVRVICARSSLDRASRRLLSLGGLKGAVPILLATLPLVEGMPEGARAYAIVLIAVAMSMVVQGTLLPTVARRTGGAATTS